MTIGVNNRMDYTGNGAVDTYAYSFKIFAATDLLVTVRDTYDVETTLTYPTHYTVSNVGRAAGGNVALVNGAFSWLDADGDLKTGYALTIRRVRPLTQTTDIRNQGGYFPEVHEDAFDHLMMVDQQQQDEIDRSVKLPETVSSDDVDATLPVPVASKVIGWNSAGDALENISLADIVTASPTFGNYAVDNYVAGVGFTAGVTTSLTMGGSVGSENNTFVTFDGVIQHKSTYSVSGATITFSSAIPGGVSEVEIARTAALDMGTPSDGTVTEVKLADGSVTTPKLVNRSVTSNKIELSAVITENIADSQVTTAKLADVLGDGADVVLGDAVATYSPTVAFGGASVGVTYSTRAGRYWKNGPRIEGDIYIVLSSKGSSTGAFTISLPVVSKAGTSINNAISVCQLQNFDASIGSVYGYIAPGVSTIGLTTFASGAGAVMDDTDVTDTMIIGVRFSYEY